MKSWKAMGLFFLVLVVSGLIFGCSDEPPPFYAGSGGGGKTAKGYQVKHWFEKDENEINQAKEAVKYAGVQWREQAQKALERAREKRNLKVEIRGPAAKLIVMVIGQDGNALRTREIEKEKMMDNIETISFGIWPGGLGDGSIGVYGIKPGDYSLVVKTFEPEKIVYKAAIKWPPTED